MKKQTAVITGGTGFIGSNLAKRLVADGWDVHLIVIPEASLLQIETVLDLVTIHYHDGTTNGMMSIFDNVKPDIVFHLASVFLAQHELKDIEPMIRSNVLFGTQLVDAMVQNEVYKLINTGTSWQHYENKKYSPVCLYAATKQAFESILTFYVEATPLKVINLKLFDTYGPGDPRKKLFTLLRDIATKQKTLEMSPGEQLIDLVYIDDVVNAFLMAGKHLEKFESGKSIEFAVSSGRTLQLREVARIFSEVTGTELPIHWGGREYRKREVMVPWSNFNKLPGWVPETDLEEGIHKMEGIIS